jgi:hypothetical protein
MQGPLHAHNTHLSPPHLPLSAPAKRHPDSHAPRVEPPMSGARYWRGASASFYYALVCTHAREELVDAIAPY